MTRVKETVLLILGAFAATMAVSALPATSSAQSSPQSLLRPTDATGQMAHIMPTVPFRAAINRAQGAVGYESPGPLLYHAGGSVMTGDIKFYVIFWVPAHLQNGAATTMPAAYQAVQRNMVANYGGHSLSAINTQYYQTIGSRTTYIDGNGLLVTSVVDTGAYPARTCTDSASPGNCLSDAQIRAKITAVMNAHGWTGGMNKMFLLFTSSGMGSCFDNTNQSCAYAQYCAYHSNFTLNSLKVIYGNEPYGKGPTTDVSICLGSNGRPNGADGIADAASTAASHEISEAITDPLLNAWFASSGMENGDLCAYDYGTNHYDAGKANQQWAGHYFDLQQEYSNHAKSVTGTGCVQVGP